MPQYTHLYAVLKCLSLDNYGNLDLPEGRYEVLLHALPDATLEVLERQAALLSDVEKETLTCGEHTEVRRLVNKKGVVLLDNFIADVFDGEQGWIMNWIDLDPNRGDSL